MQTYDVIVLGAGGVGSAALYELARRGVRAVGIDRFHPPHDRGSSHGQTRVIRQAYFEHPDYVPLLTESHRLWRELEAAAGRKLFHQVGLLEVGPADGVVVPGVLRAAAEHGLAVEPVSPREAERRWPGLRVPGDLVGVFEPSAGYLLVEDCVAANLAAAQAAGATLLADTVVDEWMADERGVRVRTSTGEIAAASLIIAAGSWAGSLLGDLPLKLNVRRKSLFWCATDSPRYDVAAGFPVYLFELPAGPRGAVSPRLPFSSLGETRPRAGVFYGFPCIDGRSMKVAEHTGGAIVDDPATVNRAIDPDEQLRVKEFLAAHLPDVSPRVVDHAVCLYTMSSDEHFIVDCHPAHANVVFAAGLSGHGFKFTPVLGRALVDLALDGSTPLAIDFLSLRRFL
jgi:glycine/D-amino acid oxidase-like deaminating enzyme